jgi:hypothetical protein
MRLLRSFFHWGLCPQAPGIYRFFSARMGMVLRGRLRATAAVAPMPFRPLNRSLGLLPSIALSRPAQVSSVSTEAVRYPIQKQRTVITLLIRCLTFGCSPKRWKDPMQRGGSGGSGTATGLGTRTRRRAAGRRRGRARVAARRRCRTAAAGCMAAKAPARARPKGWSAAGRRTGSMGGIRGRPAPSGGGMRDLLKDCGKLLGELRRLA